MFKRASFLLIAFIIVGFWLPRNAFAICTFTLSPPDPNVSMTTLTVNLDTPDFAPGTYEITVEGLPPIDPRAAAGTTKDAQLVNGKLSASFDKPAVTGWWAGKYKIRFWQNRHGLSLGGNPDYLNPLCTKDFTIKDIPVQNTCTTSIPTTSILPGTPVTLAVRGISTGTYDILINSTLKFVNTLTSSNVDINLGNTFDIGNYMVEIKNRCDNPLGILCENVPIHLQCNAVSFSVTPLGTAGGGQVANGAGNQQPQATPCTDVGQCSLANGDPCNDAVRGPGFKTAIGCIHTNPPEFVKDFLTFVIGIGGGIAFLMMLLGSFQMLTSAGNPEALQAGRERLTSAIIGLLFVIFAVLLLQVIGVDILKLPGFGRS